VAVVGDLFFRSRIQQTAQAIGVQLAFATTEPMLEEALAVGGVGLVIVDLGAKTFDAVGAIAITKKTPGVRCLAFVSHVDEEAQRRAREAGCDEVMPKSAFTRDLASILRGTPPDGVTSP
jgi:DNA-binding NarL/FixJ family response regulator